MWRRLWKRNLTSSVGIDRHRDLFYGVRVESSPSEVHLTHKGQGKTLEELAKSLAKAERVISRPPPGAFYNRRVSALKSDLRPSSKTLKAQERHQAVYYECERFSAFDAKQAVYGWKLLEYHEANSESVVEIHQSDLAHCEQFSQELAKLKLGVPRLDAWHPTVLHPLIPERFRWHLQQTRDPDGFALVREGRLHAHLSPAVLHSGTPEFGRLCHFLGEYRSSGQSGLLQVFFLDRHFRPPDIPGLSCSWAGESCQELLGQELEEQFLQPLGLALSKEPTWWLRHQSTKWVR